MDRQDYKTLHNLIWTYRHELEAYWCTPDKIDAHRFAACESAKIIDALLRQNPKYRRNHAKKVSLGQEVSQCAIMLMTALGEDFDWDGVAVEKSWPYWIGSYQRAVSNGYLGTQADWIEGLVSDALQEALWPTEDKIGYSEGAAVQALVELGQIEGVELAGEVEKELRRIKGKMNG